MTIQAGQRGTRLSMALIVCSMVPTWRQIQPQPSDDEQATICAIAMAESSGYCAAVSPVASDGTQGFGLCQIESSHTELGTFDDSNSNKWQDPVINMQMARQIFVKAGGSFSPWSTFTNGRAALYQAQAKSALNSFVLANLNAQQDETVAALRSLEQVPEVQADDPLGSLLHDLNINTYNSSLSVGGIEGFYKDVTSFVGKLTNSKAWASVGYITAGVVMLWLGITRATGIARGAVTKVARAGVAVA